MSANVIPFRRPERDTWRELAPEPLAFTIGARVDLRVGALAAGIVRPRAPSSEAFAFSALARLLRAARMTWRERGAFAPLTLAVPADIQAELEANLLTEAAIEAGCTRASFAFELCERALVSDGAALADDLRAHGWRLALRGDPDCPLPLGAHARALYGELVLQAPERPDPFLAMDEGDKHPLGRRLLAAKAAGIVLTAESVRTAAHAKQLALFGFNRGGGPFAEAGLR